MNEGSEVKLNAHIELAEKFAKEICDRFDHNKQNEIIRSIAYVCKEHRGMVVKEKSNQIQYENELVADIKLSMELIDKLTT